MAFPGSRPGLSDVCGHLAGDRAIARRWTCRSADIART